jgi:two-component system CheB/CheR fusion protein
VVGIGASAGGLEACTKLVQGLPDGNGMTFILVQHLDPTHDSLLVPLLAKHTAMPVMQAVDGMSLERDHLYIIPPDSYLAVAGGRLHLSTPTARRGRRLPFDFLLNSLANAYGKRTVCIVLSGTGADGSLGLVAIKQRGGLVIVQDPQEAEYDGMPQSAIATGAVDLVLATKDMPDALATHPYPVAAHPQGEVADDQEQRSFAAIIDLLRTTTPHDFTLYKPGTLHRRIERRMSMVGTTDFSRYLLVLRSDPDEAVRLSNDLLINVTGFFRDPKVFDRLATDIIPDLIDRHDASHPLRVWIAGCSTGEEAWSLAMLFREQLTLKGASIKLQIFASDIDAGAVAAARVGSYPDSIAAEVSAARLARFFSHDEQGFHILPELRSLVVFSVHDMLNDPPFSRLDFISCRNLLIYLRRETQSRVLSLLDFALHEGGILLLGAAETHGTSDARFETIGKAERIYRRIGRGRPIGLQFPVAGAARSTAGQPPAAAVSSQATLRVMSQRLLLETYAPAAILINRRRECLYALGPVDRYLRVATGTATQDVLILARDGVRTKLRAALHKASRSDIAPPAQVKVHDSIGVPFNIEVRAVNGPGEATHMVCFVEQPARQPADPDRPQTEYQVADLERELAAVREELAETLRSVETSGEEQRALNEDALSVNEEYQSTNEELLTSKEELQSLNEELTALNSQLQETLERQRTTSNDMQNVLYSTDVATLFLDRELNIRFFTPATRSLFKVIPSDVGRPLADLVSLAADTALLADAQAVLQDFVPVEREIEAGDFWFMRRVLPYRTEASGVEGVVITFTNVTDRKHAARALEVAKQEAERANEAKSRFLAAASHDLRQPLQALALLQGLLARTVTGEAAEQLVTRLDDTLSAMAGMLNTVLDLNQIEAGVVKADVVQFPIAGMLERLRDEYQYQAQAEGLAWTVMPCSLSIRSDPALLEQMVRNLVSNAMKYTREGRILLGCRRHGESLAIEVWDTGAGIPADKLDVIFEEYSQLDNAARDRAKGLGLGLSIVQRLADLLGHTVKIRSRLGAGSVFTVAVALGQHEATPQSTAPEAAPGRL